MAYFVLADCNNFYVSCERLFNLKLEEIPVIILSNNDGCVVARSQEAKNLGIKMGQPYFEIENFCKWHRVAVFSSNYRLYGDLSRRVMSMLSEATPHMEIYSIDEAFLKYSSEHNSGDIFSSCVALKAKIKKCLGLPISFGIATTKTLAKIANDLAKKEPQGIFNLSISSCQKEILENYPIEEVWGIGRKISSKLRSMRIYTAWDLREAEPSVIRKKMGVVLERIIWELRGLSCLDLEVSKAKKSITCSRSFGKIITEEEKLGEALALFASSACVKLRAQKSCVSALCIFLEATLNVGTGTRRTYYKVEPLIAPTNDTSEIISTAKKMLSQIFVPEQRYKKCGIVLLDVILETQVMPDFFLKEASFRSQALMKAVDTLNKRFGERTIFWGATGTKHDWKARSDKSSLYNQEQWDSLPTVKA